MQWKNLVKDYLSFSRKDRIGILVLVTATLVVYLLPYVLPSPPPAIPVNQAVLLAASDSLDQVDVSNEQRYSNQEGEGSHKVSGKLFAFDPNTLDAEGWARLGLPEKNIRTILNYRAKGGQFRKTEDLQKIWGLPKGFYERVRQHIQIERADHKNFEDLPPTRSKDKRLAIDINSADSAQWEQLPGIGAKLASRIIVFRAKLGGFYSIDQVGETYGLADSVFQKLKPMLQLNGSPKQIDINSATEDEMKNHPYIRWKLAKVIVEYRKQHGRFQTVSDLQKISIVDQALVQKLTPYLTAE
jgi:competence protein ComEA